MGYIRQDINGVSPQDVMNINNNFMDIYNKVFGDINFSDTDTSLQEKILTQWIPVQGNGNFDKNYPFELRFYIPPNVKSITSSNFNITATNYRFDSGIIESSENSAVVPVSLESGGVSGSVSCSTPSISVTSTATVPPLGIIVNVDASHNADVKISQTAHSHNMTHTHSFGLANHTHTGSANVTIPGHAHKQLEGVQISTTLPTGLSITVNGTKIKDMTSLTESNLEIKEKLLIGSWNIIKLSTTNFGNCTVYGTIEVLVK